MQSAWHRFRMLSRGLSLLAVAACTESSEHTDPPEVASATEAVVGGQAADSCAWPTTVSVNAWGACSGTLIHPRVVTTAAHCLTGPTAVILFGSSRVSPGNFSLTGRCRAGAQGTRGSGTNRDWAYCVLPDDERVKRLPITPPLVGCEAARYLKPGSEAWIVGFGVTGPDLQGAGLKRQVKTTIVAHDATAETLEVGTADASACFGDSGGPAFVRLEDDGHDWGFRVIGSTTGGSTVRCNCNCSAIFVDIAVHVREIEANEAIDVTPCTADDGSWDPTPECAALPTAPQDGSGIFPLCSLARTNEALRSCEDLAPASGDGGASGSESLAGRESIAGRGGAGGTSGTSGAGGTSGAAGRPGIDWWLWPWFWPRGGEAGSGAAAGGGGTGAAGAGGAAGERAPVAGSFAGSAAAGRSGAGAAGRANAGGGGAGAPAAGMNAAGESAAGATAVPPIVERPQVSEAGEAGPRIIPGLSIARMRGRANCTVQRVGAASERSAGVALLGFALALAARARSRSRRR